MKLNRLIANLVHKHRNQAFTAQTLRNWLTTEGLDVSMAIALIQVLLWLWPKKRVTGHPTCRKYIGGKLCGAPIVHSELKDESIGQVLELICDRKHVTRKLIKGQE